MLVISSREFRANQKSYFDRVDNGEEIIIQRKGNKSYKISPISEDDTLMSKSEFIEKINTSLKQIKEGKTTTLKGEDEIANFLATL
ncbi:MAG: type II toxin-antitoxin system Phd/YefM family antitoxin [Rikenellaceae bacterium]